MGRSDLEIHYLSVSIFLSRFSEKQRPADKFERNELFVDSLSLAILKQNPEVGEDGKVHKRRAVCVRVFEREVGGDGVGKDSFLEKGF